MFDPLCPDRRDLWTADDALAVEGRVIAARARYLAARPYPHAVIDGFLPAALARQLLDDFPPPEMMECEDAPGERRRVGKYRSGEESGLSPLTLTVLQYLVSSSFIAALRSLTGMDELTGDPDLDRSLRHFRAGGRLALHLDSSWHHGLQMHRRLNLILYLNEGWRDEWNGALELWDGHGEECVARIAPVFNRAVIFASTDRTLHGFPEPLRCPPEVTRKSLQVYYYSATRPAGEADSIHGTIFH